MTKRRTPGPKRRYWTADEDALVRARFPHEPTRALAVDLHRSTAAVAARAEKLGLAKTEAYLYSDASGRIKPGERRGPATEFRPGQAPKNKGLRRPGWSPGRMKDTQFKPGTRSGTAAAHYMPVGSTRRTQDGYVLRKVSDVPNVPQTVNWRLEHRLVWEAAHGPVPSDQCLQFINGDRGDCRLENLRLVSRRANMARNTVHNLPKPLAQAVQLLGALNRKIRRRTHGQENQDR
jgi:hypothetical protein